MLSVYSLSTHAQAGKVDRAISLLVKHGWWDRLVTLMRTMDPVKDVQQLKAAVAAFKQAGALSACMCVGKLVHARYDMTATAAVGSPLYCVLCRTASMVLVRPHK